MGVKIKSTGGGSVTLDVPSTASDFLLNLPAVGGNVVTTGDSGTITPAMLSTGRPNWDSSGNLQFNSGYGSVATAYGCRAWVNFNGTGTVAIRSSGNVSSITDLGTGQYRVNFSTSMPDANYSVVTSVDSNRFPFFGAFATGSVEVYNFGPSAYSDLATMCVSVFR